MKRPHVLIIAEDTVKIQTYTGFFGKTYAFLYAGWLKLRTAVVKFLLQPFSKVTVLDSPAYSRWLSTVDYAKNRKFYWQVVDKITAGLKAELFATRVATFLVYHYFIYTEVYAGVFDELKPDRVITLGNSYHEQLAVFIARSRKLPVMTFSFLSFNWLQKRLQEFLLNREYAAKITGFLKQSHLKKPSVGKGAVLLSVDFYRHLKTLIPLYKKLEQAGKKPYLVTDVANLQPTLDSLYFHPAEIVCLAAFLPKNFTPKKIKINRFNDADQSLAGNLCRIGIAAARPVMEKSFTLQQLYLAAAENLFKQARPSGIVVVSDYRYLELALAKIARFKRVPSVLASPNTMLDLAQINPYSAADKIAAVGNYIKKQLLNIGVPGRKITVTGDLVKENIDERQFMSNKKHVFSVLGVPPDKKIVLVISFRPTWMIPKEEKEAFIKMTLAAVNPNPNLVVVIKPHPTEKRYRLLSELSEWGVKDVIVADNDRISLLDLIHASSVVAQTWSFTVFEAIMFDRPVIAVNPFAKNYNYFLPIIKPGGAVEVKDLKTLRYWLNVFSEPQNPLTKKQLEKARRASDEFIHFSNGEASGKVLDLLAK